MSSDTDLLRQYVEDGSEAAFTALVQRYLPIVYSAALRQVAGDSHRAQDVAQQVFTVLARKRSPEGVTPYYSPKPLYLNFTYEFRGA